MWWMPWRLQAMKDVYTAKNSGLVNGELIPRCPNGETHPQGSLAEYIWASGANPENWKHLSTPEEKKSTEIPQVVASRWGACRTKH